MITTIEETYRIIDKNDPSRERGLMTLQTTMTPGTPLYAHAIRISPLEGETLEGEFSLEFVKRINSPDLYRRIRRSFNQLAGSNEGGQPCSPR